MKSSTDTLPSYSILFCVLFQFLFCSNSFGQLTYSTSPGVGFFTGIPSSDLDCALFSGQNNLLYEGNVIGIEVTGINGNQIDLRVRKADNSAFINDGHVNFRENICDDYLSANVNSQQVNFYSGQSSINITATLNTSSFTSGYIDLRCAMQSYGSPYSQYYTPPVRISANVQATQPYVEIINQSASPTTIQPGGNIAVQSNLLNSGNGNYTQSSTLGYYYTEVKPVTNLSTQATLLNQFNVGPISASQTLPVSGTFSWSGAIPSGANPGQAWIMVFSTANTSDTSASIKYIPINVQSQACSSPGSNLAQPLLNSPSGISYTANQDITLSFTNHAPSATDYRVQIVPTSTNYISDICAWECNSGTPIPGGINHAEINAMTGIGNYSYTILAGTLAVGDYYWNVRVGSSINQSCYSSSYYAFSITAGGGCSAPSSVWASNEAQTTATINWSGVSSIDHFRIDYRQVGTSSWTTVDNIPASVTSQNLSGLTCGTDYEYRLFTYTSCSGTPESSSLLTFSTTACNASTITVSSPIAGSFAQGSPMTISWNSSNVATNAPITIQIINCLDNTVVTTVVDGTITNSGSYNWSNVTLSPGDYRIKIYVTNQTNVSNIGSGCFTVSGTPTNLELTGCIAINPTSPTQGGSMTATATVTNTGGTAWTGDVALQLLSDQGAFITDLDLQTAVTILSNGTVQLNFNTASVTSPPANYQLRVQYQTTGTSTWATVPQGSCTNPLNFTVQAVSSTVLTLSGCITINPATAIQGGSLSVTATVENTSGNAWAGNVVLQLLTAQGAYLTDLDLQTNITLQPNGTQVLNFSTSNVVSQPGTYQIRVQYQTGGSGAWATVANGSCTNPLAFPVVASGGLRLTSDVLATAPQFSLGEDTLVEGCIKEISFTVTNTATAPITRGIQLFLMDAANTTVVTNIFAHAFTLAAGQSVTFDPLTTPVGINSFNGLGGTVGSAPGNYNLLLRSYETTTAPAAFDLWFVTYAASFNVPTENCGGCTNPQPLVIQADATGTCNSPVGLASVESSELRVWPNPISDGFLNISKLPSSNCQIVLYDVQGKAVIQSHSLSTAQATLDMNVLPQGMYILRISDAEGSPINTQRIIKTN